MTRVQAAISAALLSALILQPGAGYTQSPDFTGRWVIAKTDIAPWADALQKGGLKEEHRLLGQAVIFGAHSVAGPSPLGCPHAVYVTHEDTADLLFEGELAEPDHKGRARDAVALSRAIGMTTRMVLTLETGCSEVAFHRVAPDTLVFGLNDRIYTLHRAPAHEP